MKTPLAALALGSAAVAIGAGLSPVPALAAESSVPGLLRCYADGVETATIGPVFRVWQDGDTVEEPGAGADGCFWRPFARVEMPAGPPPASALAGGGGDPAGPPAPPRPAPGADAVAVVAPPPAAPPETAAAAAAAPRLMPIDPGVAADIGAATRAVDILPLDPLAVAEADDAATGPAMPDGDPAIPTAGMPIPAGAPATAGAPGPSVEPAYPPAGDLAAAARGVAATPLAAPRPAGSRSAALGPTGPHPETAVAVADETPAATGKALAVASATPAVASPLPAPPLTALPMIAPPMIAGPDLPLRGRGAVRIGAPVDPVALPGFDRPAEPVAVARTVWPPDARDSRDEAALPPGAPGPHDLAGHGFKIVTAASAADAAAPAPMPARAAAAAPAPAPRYWLQLAAMPDSRTAHDEWARRTALAPDAFGGHAPRVVEARVAGVGRVFRLWVGPWDDAAPAHALCARVQAATGPCFVQREDAWSDAG